jgi:hypothetical protein
MQVTCEKLPHTLKVTPAILERTESEFTQVVHYEIFASPGDDYQSHNQSQVNPCKIPAVQKPG